MIDSQDYVVVYRPKTTKPKTMPDPEDFEPGTIIRVPLDEINEKSIRTRYAYWVCKFDSWDGNYWNPSFRFWRHQ